MVVFTYVSDLIFCESPHPPPHHHTHRIAPVGIKTQQNINCSPREGLSVDLEAHLMDPLVIQDGEVAGQHVGLDALISAPSQASRVRHCTRWFPMITLESAI